MVVIPYSRRRVSYFGQPWRLTCCAASCETDGRCRNALPFPQIPRRLSPLTAMPPFAQGPWSGPEKLVIGIDIGTTQTAVSYIHLYPGAYSTDTYYCGFVHPFTACMTWFKVAHKL